MFGFLKEKLKQAVAKFTKTVETEAEDVEETETKQEPKKPAKTPEKKPQKPATPKEDISPKKEKKEKPAQKKEAKEEKREKEKTASAEKETTAEEQEPAEKHSDVEPESVVSAQEEPEKAAADEPEPAIQEEPAKGAELSGIKETLESYSDDELFRIMEILKFPDLQTKSDRDKRIKQILKRPLSEISSAIDLFGSGWEEEPRLTSEEIKERDGETPEEEKEEEREEEILEEVEEEEKKLEEPKKEGFLKRIFGFGKKKEKPAEDKQEEKEPEDEKEDEKKKKTGKAEKANEEKKKDDSEKIPGGRKKGDTDESIGKIDKEKEEGQKRVLEEDKEIEEIEEQEREDEEELEEEKKGFFGRLTEGFTLKKLSESKFEDLFFDLEVALLENNVAVEVIEKIKKDLHEELVEKKVKRTQIEEIVGKTLLKSLDEILSVRQIDILGQIAEKRKQNKPFVIVFVGINGSGKTTTIAKMAKYFMNNSMKTVLVAGDTFRAAAIQQLEEHANKLGIKIIKHDYGSDPAAVAFDGIKYAEAKGIDVVLIDTAGRLHSNTNLMDEMKKIIRVSNPDLKLFIGESITGNDCIEQAAQFNSAVEIDGIILSKADVDEKGGAAISVSYVTGKPILFIGTGQTYDSLQRFEKGIVLNNLGLT
jgi:fused signal recognition particle receptor